MAKRHVWRSRIGGVAAAALFMANLTTAAGASSTGDKVAAGVAGAVVGGLIGAAIANSDKNRAPGYYPPQPYVPQPAPGYYPPPPQYGSNTAWQTCLAYGNKYSQRGGALGLRLDNLISVRPVGYNSYQVSAYVSVLWPGYQTRTHVTCTVSNGTVTSWRVA